MLNERHSLYEKDAVHAVRHLPKGAKVLPMKIVASLKTMINSMLRTERIRTCVCGNFQKEDPYMLIYTANIDITSISFVRGITGCHMGDKHYGRKDGIFERSNVN